MRRIGRGPNFKTKGPENIDPMHLDEVATMAAEDDEKPK
jgi:hypothetical protein